MARTKKHLPHRLTKYAKLSSDEQSGADKSWHESISHFNRYKGDGASHRRGNRVRRNSDRTTLRRISRGTGDPDRVLYGLSKTDHA